MKILITGGTGSLGKELISQLKNHEVIIYSRDEGKQAELSDDIIKIIGDIRDFDHLNYSLSIHNPDHVIHTASLKRIDDIELYPLESVKTNILGSQNLIRACINNKIKKCIFTSTDKACLNLSVYGATKLIAERLFTNGDVNSLNTSFASVRYGNCLASRGSFLPLWYNKIKNNQMISVTSKDCSRFLFSLQEAASFVLKCLDRMEGGEVFIPKLNSFYIIDVIYTLEKILNKTAIYNVNGMRAGEKIHEDMLNENELRHTYIEDDVLIILPQYGSKTYTYSKKYQGIPLNSSLHIGDKDMLMKKIRDVI